MAGGAIDINTDVTLFDVDFNIVIGLGQDNHLGR